MKKRIKHLFCRLLMIVFKYLFTVKKRILFYCFGGSKYADSQRVISEKMHELYPEFELCWILPKSYDTNNVPSYVHIIRNNGLNFVKYVCSSFCIVNNFEFTKDFTKKKNQFFIQTYHGDRGFKKVSYEAHKFDGVAVDYKLTDLCVAGSKYGESTYRDALLYSGEILKVGMPRNDKLLNLNLSDIKVIKNTLGIDLNTKVLLFAPTFRDNAKDNQMCLLDLQRTLNTLKNKFGGEWICAVRRHSAANNLVFDCNNELIIDVSSYPDMTDLLCIADVLITDFSSCAGDFILTKKPTILCPFDWEDYILNCRELKVKSIKDPGFLVAFNQNELEKIIEELTKDSLERIYERISNFYGIYETGNSAKVICDIIKNHYYNNYKRVR